LRIIQQDLDFIEYDYSEETRAFKDSFVTIFELRSETEVELRNLRYILAI